MEKTRPARAVASPRRPGAVARHRAGHRAAFLLAATLLAAVSATGCAHRQVEEGLASWYGPGLRGHPTASGERFMPCKRTAAHRTLPFGTRVKVTNLENGRTVRVRINDRGPYVDGRIIDLSRRAARILRMLDRGVVRVRIEVVRTPGRD